METGIQKLRALVETVRCGSISPARSTQSSSLRD